MNTTKFNEMITRLREVGSGPSGPYENALELAGLLGAAFQGGEACTEFIFDPGKARNGKVYGDWAELMADIAALPYGNVPVIRFVANFTIPLVGMPVGGWFQNNAFWESILMATGLVTVIVPDGVIIDHLSRIQNGLAVEFRPATDYGMLRWSQFIPGTPWVLAVHNGGAITNQGAAPMVITPGGLVTQYFVLSLNLAAQSAIAPSLAPFARINGNDVVIGNQFNCGVFGSLNDDWVESPSATAGLVYQDGIDSRDPVLTAWAGLAAVHYSGAIAANLIYDDTLQAPVLGITQAQAMLDFVKQALTPLSGVVPPGGVVTGVFGQPYKDTATGIVYFCTSFPSGTVWV